MKRLRWLRRRCRQQLPRMMGPQHLSVPATIPPGTVSQAGRQQADATQLYLNEIGFSPLLTPEEEVHFARLARQGMKAAGAV